MDSLTFHVRVMLP